jgi:hypothetical protein
MNYAELIINKYKQSNKRIIMLNPSKIKTTDWNGFDNNKFIKAARELLKNKKINSMQHNYDGSITIILN